MTRIWRAQLRQAVQRDLTAIGRCIGLSGERLRQLRNDALLLLRLPAVAPALHQLQARPTRADYARAQTLNRAWLRQRRGRGTA